MKVILFSDSLFIPSLNGNPVIAFNANTIADALRYINNEDPDLLLIYAEFSFNNSKRQESKGIELVKHVRLTPSDTNLQKLPIVLFHWFPIEKYVENDLENLILFSPGIKRINLPYNNLSFTCPKPLAENISPFLFNSSNDEKLSEHAFRNEIAISQFNTECETNESNLIDKPIWYKKLFYKHGYSIKATITDKTQINQNLKILLIDDMGEKWKIALSRVLPNADIFVCISVFDAKLKIKEMNDSVTMRRNQFAAKVAELLSISSEIDDKREDEKATLLALQNVNSTIESAQKNILNEEKVLQSKTKELHLLLKELTQNNGLLEALIDFRTENINSDSKQKVNTLSKFIADICNSKERIAYSSHSIIENEKKTNVYSTKSIGLASDVKSLFIKQKVISKDASNLFESLYDSEYQLILLDMHLTKDSEGKDINDMDGFQILETIQKTKLKLPTAIFSATTKTIDQLKNTFRFLQKKQFIKGITPAKDLGFIISELNRDSIINRLISIIDEVIAFPVFKYREFNAYDSSSYTTRIITQKARSEIIGKMSTIKVLLESYASTKNIENLKNIIKELGDILREHRLKVAQTVYDRNNSLFKNLEKNKINSQSSNLIYWRNKISHSDNISHHEKAAYDEWCRKLDLSEIETHLTTVYRGLVFDE